MSLNTRTKKIMALIEHNNTRESSNFSSEDIDYNTDSLQSNSTVLSALLPAGYEVENNSKIGKIHNISENLPVEVIPVASLDNTDSVFEQTSNDANIATSENLIVVDNVDFEIVDVDYVNHPESVAEQLDPSITSANENNLLVFEEGRKKNVLVPYSDSSSESEDLPQKSKKRKRRLQVNNKDWFSELNKKRREKGEAYLGRKKSNDKWTYEAKKEARRMKKRCGCTKKAQNLLKCTEVTDDQRKHIFNYFWSKLTWGERKVFVDNTVTAAPTQRHRDRKNGMSSRRSQTLLYYLKIEDTNVRVCRTMYLNTLNLGRWTVHNWKHNEKCVDIVKTTKPATNNENRMKPFEKERRHLNVFLDALPVMESHYCRASSSRKYLLPEWSSKQALYNFYVSDHCQEKNIKPLSRTHFNQALDVRNISLFRPKKDECEKCAGYKVGTISETENKAHLTRKEEARQEKEKDKKKEAYVYTVDLQAVLMAPKSNVSTLYYRTKLQVHNLCFYNLNNHDGHCFLWNETEGGVTAEEFASIWVYFLKESVVPSALHDGAKIILYTDGCSYQNRNSVMANALLNLSVTSNITIVQKYLESGHTQMEADSMHSTIEKCVRNKIINVPAEYAKYCKIARKNPRPYSVKYLDHTFFKTFSEVMAFKSIRPGRVKGDLKVTEIKSLKYTPQGEIFYKVKFSDPWLILPQRKKCDVVQKAFNELKPLHENRLPITARKYDDLQVIKNTLEVDYHEFYDNIPHQ